MTSLLRLAIRSAWNRRLTLALITLAIALSTTLLLNIERLRLDARNSFSQSISGTDLIVGARSSSIGLLLYSVFRMGEITHNMSWDSARNIDKNPLVAWTIPISLGDSHRGFPVLATNTDYFDHYQYGDHQPLMISSGHRFDALFDAVIGADVAHQLGYKLGDQIILSHGMQQSVTGTHDDKPFRIVGILAATNTAVDRTIHISLQAMEAIHLDWQGGARIHNFNIPPELASKFDLTPKSITALLVGLHRRGSVFDMQREINQYQPEALMGILPGVVLDQLWDIVGVGENILRIISAMVIIVSLAGLISSILSALGERRRELAILRSVGARPQDIFTLLTIEGVLITSTGVILGLILQYLSLWLLSPFLLSHYGVSVSIGLPSIDEWCVLGYIMMAGIIASIIPAIHAYRMSLADGLIPRI